MANKPMFYAICEVCSISLTATESVESYLQFIDAHSGHGANRSIITMQSYVVLDREYDG